MKKWILVLVAIILLIIDNSFMPYFKIMDSYPSLLFIFAVSYSIINGREEGILIGVLSGLLQDVFFGNIFGVNSLLNMLICLIAAIIGEKIYKDKKMIPVISMMFLYLLKVFGIAIIFKIIGNSIDFKIGILTSVYSSIIMFFGYDYVLKLYTNEYKKSKWRF